MKIQCIAPRKMHPPENIYATFPGTIEWRNFGAQCPVPGAQQILISAQKVISAECRGMLVIGH